MGTILSLLRRFQNLDTDKICTDSVIETKEAIADNQAEQLFKGQDAEGNLIGEYRSDVYAQMKNRMNPLPGYGVPDLRLTGNFYRGIYTEVSGDTVKTDSSDNKAGELKKKYGEDIFGLNEKQKGEYLNESLRPEFKKQMEQATGLKLK